jgi:two-component system, sporulation sensor kinase D
MNEALFGWVIENIVKNAIDAMEGAGRISISVFRENEMLCVELSDTGKGISKSDWNTVFQPGFTTKSRGWGLGLSLAKRIITEYHGGRLFITSSEKGKGTTFRIELHPEL